MELYERTLYTKKIQYIIHEIFEYDISKANISILLQGGYIRQEEFRMYSEMDKIQRQIAIGKLQKNPRYAKAISDGFKQARKNLIEYNHLEESDIMSIKKDAIYTLRRLDVTDFGNIHFTLRNVFSMFISCKNLEIYFNYNERDGSCLIDIKGINDDKLILHEAYLAMICDILRLVQQNRIDDAITTIISFIHRYNTRKLPLVFYREFNSQSMFRIGNYGLDNINDDNLIPVLDISYNEDFNSKLFSIITTIKFS